MKKTIFLLLLTILFLFSGCSNSKQQENVEPAPVEEVETVTAQIICLDQNGIAHIDETKSYKAGDTYDFSSYITEELVDGEISYTLTNVYGNITGVINKNITIIAIYSKNIMDDSCPFLGEWHINEATYYQFNKDGKGAFGVHRGNTQEISYWIKEEAKIIYIGYYATLENTGDYTIDTYYYSFNDDKLILTNEDYSIELTKVENCPDKGAK